MREYVRREQISMCKMQEMEHTSDKDCLKNRYIDANLATQIVLERNRLWLSQNCTIFTPTAVFVSERIEWFD